MRRAICIGECMVELRAAGADVFARAYAGDAYNTAVYLKRSMPDAQVQFLTATGDDALSRAMREVWRAEGIDGSLGFTVSGGSPGLYLIENDERGERRFHYWRSNSAARRWFELLEDQDETVLWGADVIYLSGISLAILSPAERARAIELLRRARPHTGRIAFDPNVRLALWETAQAAVATIENALAIADVALPSREDARLLFGVDDPMEQTDRLQGIGVREIALTLGADGCLIADGGVRARLPAPHVASITDTSGAGDAFNGAYLATRLRGGSAADAARSGLAVGSRVVAHAGAVVPKSVSHP
ncbi:MAG TPA: sugar kinase [Steroidobacteraceae bacterium]|nr:sugar kinase [Steroidobacteraceae bacterium]